MSKKTIFENPTKSSEFSAEETLQQMTLEREKLIKHWGAEAYEKRRKDLEKYIKDKQHKRSAQEPSA